MMALDTAWQFSSALGLGMLLARTEVFFRAVVEVGVVNFTLARELAFGMLDRGFSVVSNARRGAMAV